MTVSIPRADGVPGISGPPDWLSAPPTGSYDLDDVRWRGATQRIFGAGSSQSASFRAVQAVVGGQQYIYLSFRVPFVQGLADQNDMVYLGLQKMGGSKAMVIRLQAHGPTFTAAGPPSANPPAHVQSVQISTRTIGAWTVAGTTPTWIDVNARMWLQSASPAPGDPNNRWAIELRIPVTTAADITDNSGPNLGTDFLMWYAITGTTTIGAPVILADYRTSGTTTQLDLDNGNYPVPSVWDEFQLTTGPAANGGVALQWGDVVVSNTLYGEGTTIANGQLNHFIARPRNYRPTAINAQDINATFRIANWGSVAGDPHQANFASGTWDYVPGNDALNPVLSNGAIPPLPPGNNPPATNPIDLAVTMNLGPNKSLHQCMLVTLSGNNLNFLNNSIFQNMNFDHTSLLAREAEISIIGLTPFSPQPRDVYLAIEKVNMLRNTPGANEGRFLNSSMRRLIAQGGPLGQKLATVQTHLDDGGDYGSAARLEAILHNLHEALAAMEYSDREQGLAALSQLIEALNEWFSAVKEYEEAPGSVERLAMVFDTLADWLLASDLDATLKLATFVAQLNQWLSGLSNDPASSQLLPPVVQALRTWLSTLVNGERFTALIDTLARWLADGRPPAELPAVLNALRELLTSLSSGNNALKPVLAMFARGIARWLRGFERLDVFVNELTDAGLTTDELDQLFPTLRVHVYHDTGERVTGADSQRHPVLRAQSSFGLYSYHEGNLEGWQTSIQGAQRIADNLYLLAVPNNGTSKVTVRVQSVEPGEERIPEDPINPNPIPQPGGCLMQLLKLLAGLFGRR